MPHQAKNGEWIYLDEEKQALANKAKFLNISEVDEETISFLEDLIKAGMLYQGGVRVAMESIPQLKEMTLDDFQRCSVYNPEADDFYEFQAYVDDEPVSWTNIGDQEITVVGKRQMVKEESFNNIQNMGFVDEEDEDFLNAVKDLKTKRLVFKSLNDQISNDPDMDLYAGEFEKQMVQKPGTKEPEFYVFVRDEQGRIKLDDKPLSAEEACKRIVGEPPKKPNGFLTWFDSVLRTFGSKDGLAVCREYESKQEAYDDKFRKNVNTLKGFLEDQKQTKEERNERSQSAKPEKKAPAEAVRELIAKAFVYGQKLVNGEEMAADYNVKKDPKYTALMNDPKFNQFVESAAAQQFAKRMVSVIGTQDPKGFENRMEKYDRFLDVVDEDIRDAFFAAGDAVLGVSKENAAPEKPLEVKNVEGPVQQPDEEGYPTAADLATMAIRDALHLNNDDSFVKAVDEAMHVKNERSVEMRTKIPALNSEILKVYFTEFKAMEKIGKVEQYNLYDKFTETLDELKNLAEDPENKALSEQLTNEDQLESQMNLT